VSVRWQCPNGCGAVLGPERPRRDDVRRYCLACSKRTGRLVERQSPALERKRAERAERAAAVAARQRARTRELEANATRVDVLDYDGTPTTIDAGALLRAAWNTDELRHWRGRRAVPPLEIRRGTGSAVRSRRDRDGVSGHAKVTYGRIVLTVHPGLGREWLEMVVAHEAAHIALPPFTAHAPAWRGAYVRTVRELYGVSVPNAGATWTLDEAIAVAIRSARA
jgi:hypothetical protein